MCARLGLDQLKCRTNGVCGGVSSTAEQCVSLAHLDEHGAEVVALCQICADGLHVHLALAQVEHGLSHLVHLRIGSRVDDLGAGDVEAARCSRCLDLVDIADQNDVHQLILEQTRGSFQDAGIRTLGEYNLSLVRLENRNQIFKHNAIPPNS